MAKWGEGDPRWIVEERPDAVNVNNWHWSEKNATNWSKDKIKELLVDFKIDDPNVGVATITEITSMEGEAVANNRKAKLIFFYEWVIKAKWTASANGGKPDSVRGTFEVPNLSEENEPDELDVQITVDTSGKESDMLKDLMRNKGTDLIRGQLAKYIAQLKTDFAKDLIKPTKDAGGAPVTTTNVVRETGKLSLNHSSAAKKPEGKPVAAGVKLEMKSLEITEELKCRKEEIYNVFTELEFIRAFTRGPATVDAVKGGKFVMFDGNVTGEFTELDRPNEIRQKWRFRSWPEGHYSEVVIKFAEQDDHTNLTVTQSGIPASDFERTENGWRNFYFRSIKNTFGFGATLY